MTAVSDELHAAFKASAQEPPRQTIQALSELGMLLVLVEKGKIRDMAGALALGARAVPAVMLKRILAGEDW